MKKHAKSTKPLGFNGFLKNKMLSMLLLMFVGILFSQCNKDDDCDKYLPASCDLVELSNDYDPVCGCDGVTYQNSGWAVCMGGVHSFSIGECN